MKRPAGEIPRAFCFVLRLGCYARSMWTIVFEIAVVVLLVFISALLYAIMDNTS